MSDDLKKIADEAAGRYLDGFVFADRRTPRIRRDLKAHIFSAIEKAVAAEKAGREEQQKWGVKQLQRIADLERELAEAQKDVIRIDTLESLFEAGEKVSLVKSADFETEEELIDIISILGNMAWTKHTENSWCVLVGTHGWNEDKLRDALDHLRQFVINAMRPSAEEGA